MFRATKSAQRQASYQVRRRPAFSQKNCVFSSAVCKESASQAVECQRDEFSGCLEEPSDDALSRFFHVGAGRLPKQDLRDFDDIPVRDRVELAHPGSESNELVLRNLIWMLSERAPQGTAACWDTTPVVGGLLLS